MVAIHPTNSHNNNGKGPEDYPVIKTNSKRSWKGVSNRSQICSLFRQQMKRSFPDIPVLHKCRIAQKQVCMGAFSGKADEDIPDNYLECADSKWEKSNWALLRIDCLGKVGTVHTYSAFRTIMRAFYINNVRARWNQSIGTSIEVWIGTQDSDFMQGSDGGVQYKNVEYDGRKKEYKTDDDGELIWKKDQRHYKALYAQVAA
jgi:hypothetical protein